MMPVALRVALSLLLSVAAGWDLRERRVPLGLMWLLLGVGILIGLLGPERPAALAALGAAVASSVRRVPRRARIIVCLLAGAASIISMRDDPDLAASTVVVFAAWLLWELNYWGGADASVALAVLAMFPRMDFVAWLASVLGFGSFVMLVLRHRARTPLVLMASIGDVRNLRAPSRLALDANGQPAVWMLALAGIAYMWWGA